MAFTVSINGNNYFSEKRRTKFEEALEDGQRVKLGGNGQKPPNSKSQTKVIAQAVPEFAPSPPAQPQQPRDYSRLFETLELGLKQSYGHQSETLRVHQQYLHNQAEYANIFSKLMQQQGTLFANGNTAPEKSEIALTVLNSLAKSIEQFHQHQTETLNVHNQFLNQQSAYSQAFVQLLHQQVNGVNGANGGTKSNYEVNLVPAVKVQPDPIPEPVFPVRTQEAPVQVKVIPAPQHAVITPAPIDYTEFVQTTPNSDVVDSKVLSEMLLSIVSEKTGYPVEMLELDMDMEADLGIDSIKRVEILGALQDQAPGLPEINTEILGELRTLAQIITYIDQSEDMIIPAIEVQQEGVQELQQVPPELAYPAPAVDLDALDLKTSLLDIVSEKTGYPAEMLELNMDMEADLGIDSIKRVEILGALQDRYPGMPEVDADTLTDLRTLQQIIDYIDIQEPAEKKV